MKFLCRCQAQVRIIARTDYKQLKFFGTHDEDSHITNGTKKLKYEQIITIHESVMVALNQSAAVLLPNLLQCPEQHKHMDPSQQHLIQQRVQSARLGLTKQKLDGAIPETLGELIAWCKTQDFYSALRKHNDPDDAYCLQLFSTLAMGSDIKADPQLIHINFSTQWWLLNHTISKIEYG